MSIVSVRETYGALSGSGSMEGVREYTKVFTVITDSASDGIMAVGNAAGIPKKGDTYYWQGESDGGALCQSVTPRQESNSEYVWQVTCSYSSDSGGGKGNTDRQNPIYDVPNPLARPPEVTWSSWVENEIVTHDVNDKPILLPTGAPYYPPLQRKRKRRMVMVIKSEADYPIALSQNYEQSVNSDSFFGGSPGTVMLEDVSATAQFDQNQFYWRVRYEFRFRTEGWKQEVLRAGTFTLEHVTSSGGGSLGYEPVLPQDRNGIYHTNPILMDEDGVALTQSQVEERRAVLRGEAGGLFDIYEIFESKSYSALEI
jgi:hypothetical protein